MNKCFHIALAIWFFAVIPLVFAEDFQNRPTLSGLNEVVNQATVCGNALNKRDVVVSRNQIFSPYCGHGQSYFASLQHELQEHLAIMYIDCANGPLNTAGTDFLYFTLATWREAAELNEDGFQRFDSDGNFIGYGIAQSNDGILPTVFNELQVGFGVLKWHVGSLGWTDPGSSEDGYHMYLWPEEIEHAKIMVEAEYDSSSGGAGSPTAYTKQFWNYAAASYMGRVKGTPTCVTLSIPHSVSLYVRGTTYPAAESIYDDNGDGISESASFYLQESSGDDETGLLWTGSTIGGTEKPNWCPDMGPPFPEFGGKSISRGYNCLGIVLIKYNFTNDN